MVGRYERDGARKQLVPPRAGEELHADGEQAREAQLDEHGPHEHLRRHRPLAQDVERVDGSDQQHHQRDPEEHGLDEPDLPPLHEERVQIPVFSGL